MIRTLREFLFDDMWAFVALVLGCAFAGVEIAIDYRGEQACLRAGFPQATTSLTGVTYCIKRVGASDTVVPLGDLR